MIRYTLVMLGVILVMVAGQCHADEWNVANAGAVGDGVTDNTAAFQQLMDKAHAAGGGIVNVPAGKFRINGNLVIPAGVTLQGTYRTAPQASDLQGSVLQAYAGRGSREGKPFIALGGPAATVAGLIITYPEWKQEDVPPVPYPPCIGMNGGADNVSIIDCGILNAYEAINLTHAGRHLVRNVNGYPSWRGLYVDACYDIGRIENVHFWPFGVRYKPDNPYCKWINLNGVAFEFARTDWQYVTNTFCFGYGVGYKFSESKSGSCNGSFLSIGADSCERAVLVEQSQGPGLLITNGEFVGRWSSKDAVPMDISEKNVGRINLSNCSFWGPNDTCVRMRAPEGQFVATGCNFCEWDNKRVDSAAIQIDAGSAVIQGNTFGSGTTHVEIGNKVKSAIIMGNQAVEGIRIKNNAGSRTQAIANQKDTTTLSQKERSNYKVIIGSSGDSAYLRNWYNRERPEKDLTMRWSGPISKLVLQVIPGKTYQMESRIFVPQYALQPDAGLYIGNKQIYKITKSGYIDVSCKIPAVKTDKVTVDVRCKGWSPCKVISDNLDQRELGIELFWVKMKSEGSGKQVFDANNSVWIK